MESLIRVGLGLGILLVLVCTVITTYSLVSRTCELACKIFDLHVQVGAYIEWTKYSELSPEDRYRVDFIWPVLRVVVPVALGLGLFTFLCWKLGTGLYNILCHV